jgi:hypothetical protein
VTAITHVRQRGRDVEEAGIVQQNNGPLVDGPCHPYTWCQRSEILNDTMQPGAWRMVNYLWQQPNHSATFDDLKFPVYDDRDHIADAKAFGSFRRAANAFFREHHIPWRVVVKKTVVSLTATE